MPHKVRDYTVRSEFLNSSSSGLGGAEQQQQGWSGAYYILTYCTASDVCPTLLEAAAPMQCDQK